MQPTAMQTTPPTANACPTCQNTHRHGTAHFGATRPATRDEIAARARSRHGGARQ